MSEDLILFWHRRDLRIDDNLGLINACQASSKVVGLFCLDPNILNRDDIAPVRVHYMIGCLEYLQKEYQKLGSQLLIL
ncbi:MAG: deoxyribodipyrimidine photo-lyase, partial [Planktothrix sp.]